MNSRVCFVFLMLSGAIVANAGNVAVPALPGGVAGETFSVSTEQLHQRRAEGIELGQKYAKHDDTKYPSMIVLTPTPRSNFDEGMSRLWAKALEYSVEICSLGAFAAVLVTFRRQMR